MKAAALTVAIPTYNGASHIEQALRSILDQTEVPFDLIISDDQSSDDTVSRIRDLAGDQAEIEINPTRLGLAGNWNRCIERATTSFLAIFHQDDVMHSGHLASHLATFRDDVALVASAVTMIDQNDRPVAPSIIDPGGCGTTDHTFAPGEFLDQLAIANPLRCSAVTLRTDAIRAIHGFRSTYRYVVDWDAWIRLANSSSTTVAWLAAPTVSMRWHIASETHSFKTGTTDLDESLELLESLYEMVPRLTPNRPQAHRKIARAFLNRAYEAAKARRSDLVRKSLIRSLQLSRRTLKDLACDPRLTARLIWGICQAKGNSQKPEQ